MTWHHLELTQEQHTMIITINRPEVRNALSQVLIDELIAAIQQSAEDKHVRSLIITGKGKAFCAGLDLAELKGMRTRSTEDNRRDSARMVTLLETLYHHPKPTIAALNGHAIAGGAGIASVCDFVVMADNAKFGYSESRIGFVAAIVAVYLIRQVGERHAKDLLLRARLIAAEEAQRIGLVNVVCPSDAVLLTAQQLAAELHANAPSSLALSKSLLANLYGMGLAEGLRYASELNALARTTDELSEGINAFLEKRAPAWQTIGEDS